MFLNYPSAISDKMEFMRGLSACIREATSNATSFDEFRHFTYVKNTWQNHQISTFVSNIGSQTALKFARKIHNAAFLGVVLAPPDPKLINFGIHSFQVNDTFLINWYITNNCSDIQ